MISLSLRSSLFVLLIFSPYLSAVHYGEVSGWEFTYRPRAGDSGRELVDVVEDYLEFFSSTPSAPQGIPSKEWKEALITSANTDDYEWFTFGKHEEDCSSHQQNKEGTIRPISKAKKKVALKSESFYDIVTRSEIVEDRTLLMLGLFTKKFNGKHIHLQRKAGWGKTVALDMIRRFIGLEVDENGRPLPEEKKVNRILFQGGPITIDNQTRILPRLKIGNRDVMVDRFGKYPIIYFSFKNVTGTSFNEIFQKLKQELVKLVHQHKHLFPVFKSKRFGMYEKKLYKKFLKNKTNLITVEDVKNCCMTLTRATKHFYKRRPIILFDDYDVPMRSSYEHVLHNRDEVFDIMDLVDDMFCRLIFNDFLDARKVFTTGVLPFPRHEHRVFTYLDFHLLRYELDLYLGLRDKSTTLAASREWSITPTTWYWLTDPNIIL